MKAIRVHQVGGPETMRLEEIPLPEPEAGRARVRLTVSGVNFIDVYQRLGQYKMPLPFTPGMEGAGVVDALGEGVIDVTVGDRVAWAMIPGSYAEYAIIPAARLVPIPDGVDDQQAAALMIQGMTAQYLTTSTCPLGKGDTVLIHAGAGGTGRLLLQAAKRRGVRAIVTVGTPEKAELALSAGADAIILYREEDFVARVKELTDGRGVDVVFDSVGVDTFEKGLNCLRPRGLMVLWGQSSGPVPPLDPQVLNAKGSLYLTRPNLGAYVLTREELLARSGDVFTWAASGELDVRIDRTFPLAEAAQAHRVLEDRQSKGKLLLIP